MTEQAGTRAHRWLVVLEFTSRIGKAWGVLSKGQAVFSYENRAIIAPHLTGLSI